MKRCAKIRYCYYVHLAELPRFFVSTTPDPPRDKMYQLWLTRTNRSGTAPQKVHPKSKIKDGNLEMGFPTFDTVTGNS